MTYPILLFLGFIALVIALQITEEVYRLALLAVSVALLGWIYLISPFSVQLLMSFLIYVWYQRYRASLKS